MSQSGDGSMSQSSYSTGADSASTFADTADRRAINDLQERSAGAIAWPKMAEGLIRSGQQKGRVGARKAEAACPAI